MRSESQEGKKEKKMSDLFYLFLYILLLFYNMNNVLLHCYDLCNLCNEFRRFLLRIRPFKVSLIIEIVLIKQSAFE